MTIGISNPKRAIYICAAIVVGLTIAVLLGELALRLLGLSREIMYAPNPYYGWQHIPNTRYRYHFDGRSIDVHINSDGLRSPELDIADPEDHARVLILGDSFAEAMQVQYEESFPRLIQLALNDTRGDTFQRINVINAGVSGFGTDNELLYYMHEGHKYGADVVVLAFCLCNDVRNNHMALELIDAGAVKKPYYTLNGEELRLISEPTLRQTGVVVRFKLWLNLHSRLYTLAKQIRNILRYRATVTEIGMPLDYNLFRIPLDSEWTQAFQITKKLILALNTAVNRNGGRLMVALIPTQYQIDDNYWHRQTAAISPSDTRSWDLNWPNKALQIFLEENDVPYIDLLPVFHERAVTTNYTPALYFEHDGHWTTAGHTLAADALADTLSDILARADSDR